VNIYKLPKCVEIFWWHSLPTITVVLFAFLLSETTTAQTFIGRIHGGINLSQLSGDDLNGFSKAGLHVGGSISYPWANQQKQIAIELLYQQKGSSGSDLNGLRQFIGINSLSLPLVYRWGEWYNDQSDRHNFYVEVGAVVNSIIGVSSENTFFDTFTDDFNDFDWGLLGGIHINLGQRLSTTIRYERSISNIYSDPLLNIRGLQSFLFTLRLDYRL
jgi:hypothetical protein